MPFSRPTSPTPRKTLPDDSTRAEQLFSGMLRGSPKGKERATDDDLASPYVVPRPVSIAGFSVTSSPVSSSPTKRPSSRGSMLLQASDVLGSLKFGRRRKSVRQPIPPPRMPIILPEVIEITAPPPSDVDVEERDRLREEAAQALGLGAASVVDNIHNDNSHDAIQEQDEQEHSEFQEEGDVNVDKETLNDSVSRTSESTPAAPNNQLHQHPHHLISSLSVSIPSTPQSPTNTVIVGRHRSGSMPAAPHSHHNRSSSIIPTPVPPFPSTPSSLSQFIQISSTLPKYYPASSLRIFALSKQWKNRFMVLSTPTSLPTLSRNPSPSVSYLHLFKSSAAEEKELERLEINEDSVVFVADDEVGGRRHVIKVGGKDVGALKKELNTEDGGRTMWFLQITDSSESQKWITSIKNAIFGQRTMRAGLAHSNPLGSGIVEPRGDMDVMLSMRTQGIISSPTRAKFEIADQTSSTLSSPTQRSPADASRSYAPSIASVHTQSTIPRSSNTGGNAVLSLKGLFSGSGTVGRPRSSSRATSLVESENANANGEEGGNKLMSILRTPTTDSMASVLAEAAAFTGAGGSRGNITPPTTSHQTHLSRALSLSSGSMSNRHTGSILSTISGLPRTTDTSMGVVHPSSVDFRLDRKILVNPISVEGDQVTATAITTNTHRSGEAQPSSTSTNPDRASRTMSIGSISLLPPPRKRWTSSGPVSALNNTDSPATSSQQLPPDTHSEMGVMGFYVQNASTSSIVETDDVAVSHSPPPASTTFLFGTPEQRPRSPSSRSMRSISTLASAHSMTNSPINGNGGGTSPGVDRSSIGTKRHSGRRWSRQLPQRLTPPSIPPPAIPGSQQAQAPTQNGNTSPTTRSLRHPYSVEKGSSSQSSVISTLPSKFSKRASASSAFSVKTTSTSHSFGNVGSSSGSTNATVTSNGVAHVSHTRAGSSNRASISPPPRPAPTFALPPAPVSAPVFSNTESASSPTTPTSSLPPSSSKRTSKSFRESVTNRALRLSLSAPKPPPSSVLPPRPDEVLQHGRNKSQTHSRSPSASSQKHRGSSLYSIPGSPKPPSPLLASPFPPPVGPLPPTPQNNLPEPPPLIPPPSRGSLKQRLRILSAPSPISSSTPSSAFINGISGPPARPSSASRPSTIMTNISPPSTPHGSERGHGYFQNDSSFLTLATPATPSLPTPKIHTITEPEPEPVVSLSPPPRRGSKRISIPEAQIESSISNEPAPPLPDPMPDPLPSAVAPAESTENNKLLSLSRHGSVISLGIVSM